MPEIEVVHLVWAAAGIEPFRNFLRSYRHHPAGSDHGLVILYNGFGAGNLGPHRALLADIPHRELRSEERRVGKECRSRWSPYH